MLLQYYKKIQICEINCRVLELQKYAIMMTYNECKLGGQCRFLHPLGTWSKEESTNRIEEKKKIKTESQSLET